MGKATTLLAIILVIGVLMSSTVPVVAGKPDKLKSVGKPEKSKPVDAPQAAGPGAKPEEARTPLTCEPRFTEVEVGQGGTATITLTITAHDDDDVEYRSKVVGSGDARDWVTLDSEQLTLSAGGSGSVTATVSVPSDATPGTYNLLIKYAPPPGRQGSPEGDGCHLIIRVSGASSTPPTEDTTPPTTTLKLSGVEGSNGWYVSDVTVNLTAVDNEGGSGVKEIHYILDGNDEVVVPSYTVEFTISEEGIHHLTYWAVDYAGNEEEHKEAEIKIDKTPPIITITVPSNGAQYILGEPVYADWSAEDLVSGVAEVTATAENGALIDTSTVGPKEFTVTAHDYAGLSSTATVTYYVIYGFKLLKDGNTHNLGSAVEIMWQYTDYSGNPVDSTDVSPSVTVVMPNETVINPEPPGGAQLLQYNSDSYTWHINWKTDRDWPEGGYTVRIHSAQTGQTDEVTVELVKQGQGNKQ